MTAIGFVMAIIGAVLGVAGEANFNRTVVGAAGWLITIGAALIVSGCAIKLWEIMP